VSLRIELWSNRNFKVEEMKVGNKGFKSKSPYSHLFTPKNWAR
jgi:hypothetical protein